MRIVSWNCGGWSCGGFNIDRYNKMMSYQPEILLVQECTKKEYDSVCMAINDESIKTLHLMEDVFKEKINFDNSKLQHWYGDNVEESYKGTAIFSTRLMYNAEENSKGITASLARNIYNVELFENFNNEFRYVIPYRISFADSSSNKNEYILLSIWTKQPSDGSWNYQKTVFDALDYYEFDKSIILAGDFNTGSKKNEISSYLELKKRIKKIWTKELCGKYRI
jgi:hypothetical protein